MPRFYITKSRSGHYTVTAKDKNFSASIGKLSCKISADNAKAEVLALLEKKKADQCL